MYARLCNQIKTDGTPCRAVALTNRPCCFAHQRLEQRNRRRQRAMLPPAIRLGPLRNHDAIGRAALRVARAIAHGAVDLDRASGLMHRIHTAACTLQAQTGLLAPPLPREAP
jgi:hypothetical protein